MTLSQANAAAMVRGILDLIDNVADTEDCTEADFQEAVVLLNDLARKRGYPKARSEGSCILEILTSLNKVRS